MLSRVKFRLIAGVRTVSRSVQFIVKTTSLNCFLFYRGHYKKITSTTFNSSRNSSTSNCCRYLQRFVITLHGDELLPSSRVIITCIIYGAIKSVSLTTLLVETQNAWRTFYLRCLDPRPVDSLISTLLARQDHKNVFHERVRMSEIWHC